MSNHTPGPWRVTGPIISTGKWGGHLAVKPRGELDPPLCFLPKARAGGRDDIAAANAHLIAAAPELLKTLQNLLPAVDSEIEQRKFGGNDEDWASLEALSSAAHAVIAKAKGKA